MVNQQEQDSGRRPANQGVRDVIPEPNRINASTPYDFNGRSLTPRSEEHTSELQSLRHLVCRLLLVKKMRRSPSTPLSPARPPATFRGVVLWMGGRRTNTIVGVPA